MKHRLPVLTEVAVREMEISRQHIGGTFTQQAYVNASQEGRRITCAKGCSNCCHYPTTISLLEGLSLYLWLKERGLWKKSLRTRLEEAHARVKGLASSVWMISVIPCVFLEDRTCAVYEARPFACRTTASKYPAEFCHPHRFGEFELIPRQDCQFEFELAERLVLSQAQLPIVRVPIATATLVGEQIARDPTFDPIRWLVEQLK